MSIMNYLDELENKSIYIIREVYKRFKNPSILWSAGKDSTVLIWLCRQAFFGKIHFPVIHIDTGYKFKEIYEFRDKYVDKWKLNLIVAQNKKAIKRGITPDKGKFECCNALKTEALKQVVKKHKIDALLLGIRRDEHGIRDKERYFSPRDKQFRWHYAKEKLGGDSDMESEQDAELDGWNIFSTDFCNETDHVRIHPLLHWTELDILEYIREKNIPIAKLYFAKNGKRYRSIGCECCCKPVDSSADNIDKIVEELKTTKILERAGRAQDKEDEYHMQRLRSLGYM